MIIQKATIKDLEALTVLFDLYRIFYEQTSDLEGAREFLKARIMNDESVVLMAVDGEHPIGCVQ
ncbi:GNAT family N-acetyltransferase, partial [Neobacillus drentensis]